MEQYGVAISIVTPFVACCYFIWERQQIIAKATEVIDRKDREIWRLEGIQSKQAWALKHAKDYIDWMESEWESGNNNAAQEPERWHTFAAAVEECCEPADEVQEATNGHV